MSTKTARYIVFCAFGMFLGAVGGTLLARRICPEYEEIFPEDDAPWIREEEETPIVLNVKTFESKIEKKDYTKVYNKGKKETVEDLEKMAENILAGKTVNDETEEEKGVFEIISLHDYNSKENTNEKKVLNYYEADDTLVDMFDNIVTDPEKLIGPDSLTSFGIKSMDRDIVYIRNHNTASDYLIVRNDESYIEEVDDKPKKPKTKSSGRTRKVQNLEEDEE